MLRKSFVLTSALLLGSMAVSFARAGDLKIVGSGDGMELLQAVATEYAAANPGKTATIPPSIGTGGGITAVGTDKEIMGRIARALTDAEKAQGLVATPLVRVPVGIFVHPSAGVTQLTSAQTVDIFLGKIRNWSEVGGRDLTLRIVRRDVTDSTFATLRATMPGWQDLVITDRSKLTLTTTEMFDTVRTTEGTIGFGPYAKVLAGDVTYLKIDGKFPTDSDYRSTSTLSLLHKTSTVTDEAKAFIAFAATPKAKDAMKNLGGLVQ
jgi:phosphate transport system substrate-binding protein